MQKLNARCQMRLINVRVTAANASSIIFATIHWMTSFNKTLCEQVKFKLFSLASESRRDQEHSCKLKRRRWMRRRTRTRGGRGCRGRPRQTAPKWGRSWPHKWRTPGASAWSSGPRCPRTVWTHLKANNCGRIFEWKHFDVALQIANGNVPTHVTYPKNYILAVAGWAWVFIKLGCWLPESLPCVDTWCGISNLIL